MSNSPSQLKSPSGNRIPSAKQPSSSCVDRGAGPLKPKESLHMHLPLGHCHSVPGPQLEVGTQIAVRSHLPRTREVPMPQASGATMQA